MELWSDLASKLSEQENVTDGRKSVERRFESNVVKITDHESREWARLIRKLRWIGLDENAKRLKMAVSACRQTDEPACR